MSASWPGPGSLLPFRQQLPLGQGRRSSLLNQVRLPLMLAGPSAGGGWQVASGGSLALEGLSAIPISD